MGALRKAKMEEIHRNLTRVREIRADIAKQCEENARTQEENALTQKHLTEDIRHIRERTDRHVERLENGYEDEDTGRITLEPAPAKR